jgi:hypothetical protein
MHQNFHFIFGASTIIYPVVRVFVSMQVLISDVRIALNLIQEVLDTMCTSFKREQCVVDRAKLLRI